MHFTYELIQQSDELLQGDVLERTQEINSLLEVVHPHFHRKENNLFFMVLTQSCDLVQRQADSGCKASYITIAPVRPIESVIERQIESLQTFDIRSQLPVLTDKAKTKMSEFLQRLFNNNEPGYFFLESSGTPLPGDCCAYLTLSIAIKASEHFHKCLAAKRIQLTEPFQAKLGWLVGQMYSRVGTKDWETKVLNNKVQRALNDAAIWIPDANATALQAEYSKLKEQNVDVIMTEKQIKSAIKGIPTKKNLVLEQASVVLNDVLGPEHAHIATKIRKRLENDTVLTQLLK